MKAYRGQVFSALAVASFLAAGCPGCNRPSKTVVKITPREFVTGDVKRLQSHLELQAARVSLERSGPESGFEVSVEVWKHGKLDRPGSGSTSPTVPSEVSISLRRMETSEDKETYRVVVHETVEQRHTKWYFGVFPVASTSTGGSSFATDVTPNPSPSAKPPPGHMPIDLENPIELTEQEPVAIWAYGGFRDRTPIPVGAPILKTIAGLDWAIVVKVRLRNAP